MFKKVGKKTSKVLAYLLALMVMVGYVPAELLVTAMAADGDEVPYTIIVKCGDTPLEDVLVTAFEDPLYETEVTGTTDANGEVTLTLKEGESYVINAELEGYELNGIPSITVGAVNSEPKEVLMSQLATITGIVKYDGNAYQGATVTLSGYTVGSTTTDENGEFELTGHLGEEYTVKVTPKSEDEKIYSVAERTFTPDAVNYALAPIDFSIATYKVSADGITHGTVKFYSDVEAQTPINDLEHVPYGTNVTVKVEADANYRVKANSFKVNSTEQTLTADNKYTFKVNGTTEVTAEFEQYLFAVNDSVTGEDHGTVLFDGLTNTGKAEKDSPVKVSVSADPGYCIESLIINGTPVENVDGRKTYPTTIASVSEDVSVVVKYRVQTYTITFTVGENGEVKYKQITDPVGGEISVSTPDVSFNESIDKDNPTKVTVTATPETGYRVANVTIDGTTSAFDENDKTHTYDFEMTENHTYAVTFTKNVYQVTLGGYVSNDGSVKILVNDEQVRVGDSNKISVKHGDKIKLDLDPVKNQKTKKTVSRAEIGSYNCMEEDVFDNEWNWLEEKEGVPCVSDVSINVTFTNIDQCDEVWSNYVEIIGTSSGQQIVNLTDADGNFVYISNGNLKVKLIDNVKYKDKKITAIDYLFKNSENFVGYKNSKEIKSSKEIVELQIYNGTEYSVNLGTKSIIFVIDKVVPVVALDSSIKDNKILTNEDSVTITGTVTDENTATNPSSGIDRVVYSTSQLDDASVKALPAESTVELEDGKYSFETIGEQNKNYYIYAIDIAGNVSDAQIVNVVIDKTAPEFKGETPITFSGENVYQDGTSVASAGKIKMTITADDISSKTIEKVDPNDATGSTVTTETVAVPCSDLKKAEVSYEVNGNIERKEISFETGKAEFIFEAKSEYTNVKITIFDKAGNSTVFEKNYSVVINDGNFDIVDPIFEPSNENNKLHDDGTTKWFKNTDVKLSFSLNSIDSLGIIKEKSVKVSVNEKEVEVKKENGKYISELKLKDSENKTALEENKENKVIIKVVTNTGTETVNEFTFNVDTTPATIEKFDFAVKNQNKGAELINFLTFGIFCNQEIEVTVTAADTGDTGAGVKTITLLAGDGYPLGEVEVEDNKATFTIPADEVTDNAPHFNKTISAVATDNVGNTTKTPVFPNTDNSNAKSSGLMIETINPTIVVDYPEEPANQNEKTATAGEWYNGDIDFAFDIKDNESGIRSVVISINGETLVDKIYKENDTDIEEHEGKFNVSTSQVEANTDGSYKLEATVIDNAGNVNNMKPVTVYKDTDAPYITKFAFEGTGYKESSEEKAVAQITDYGFYFTADTKVTVYAEDAIDADGKKVPSAGIKEIICYTQAVNQTEKVEVTDVTANADGTYSFTIIAGFKGQIFAEVNDNVGNGSGICSPDKAVVESKDQHDAAEDHIVFSIPETNVKTASGSPLYKATVPVTITVADAFAGIREIEWSVEAPYDKDNEQKGKVIVGNDKTIEETITEGRETGWSIDATDSNLITKMSKTITVNNNSNGIKVIVTMTDRAGNTTTDDISFSIDKTAPVIEVTYDNNTPDAEYDSFYKANRTATITITERNFNPDDVKIVIENTDNVIPKLSNWTKTAVEDGIHPDGTVYTAKIDYVADGDYTFDIDYSDRATNAAEYVVGVGSDGGNVTNDDFVKHEFTIDKTNPVVKVTYDNNKALNKNYYDAERTATITVTEHNFDASRIVVTGEATDNGKKIKFPAITGWSSKGDVHTTTINYKADAEYTFDIKVTDKADNVDDSYKVETFFVDKTAPDVEITGVANNSANNGKVAPVVNYTDTNFTEDGVTVTLTGVNRGRVDYSRGVAKVANGQTMSYENFRNVKEVDDIYTLTAKVVDKAGNETTKTISFSVNRFGSTYNLEAVKSYNNKYIQSMGDLVFTEVNVNSLDLGNIRVKLTKNGTPSDLVINKDFTVDVAGGGGRWYTYTYTIKSALFQDDAKYSLSFYSVDASGNVNENIDETKEAVVSFAVDKTKPVIIPIDLADGERYKETVKNVTIEVKDNLLLENVKIYLNDSEVEYKVEGESYTIQVPESPERQTIKIVAVDAAGNEYETTVKDILVSTNAFVQFVNNTPVFIGSIVALVAVIGAIIAFIILGKKKRRK